MGYALPVTVQMTDMECGSCGITFAVPEEWRAEKQKTGKGWYCPNGCQRVYKESDVDRLKRQLHQPRAPHGDEAPEGSPMTDFPNAEGKMGSEERAAEPVAPDKIYPCGCKASSGQRVTLGGIVAAGMLPDYCPEHGAEPVAPDDPLTPDERKLRDSLRNPSVQHAYGSCTAIIRLIDRLAAALSAAHTDIAEYEQTLADMNAANVDLRADLARAREDAEQLRVILDAARKDHGGRGDPSNIFRCALCDAIDAYDAARSKEGT
jgi:hypothetical protein